MLFAQKSKKLVEISIILVFSYAKSRNNQKRKAFLMKQNKKTRPFHDNQSARSSLKTHNSFDWIPTTADCPPFVPFSIHVFCCVWQKNQKKKKRIWNRINERRKMEYIYSECVCISIFHISPRPIVGPCGRARSDKTRPIYKWYISDMHGNGHREIWLFVLVFVFFFCHLHRSIQQKEKKKTASDEMIW